MCEPHSKITIYITCGKISLAILDLTNECISRHVIIQLLLSHTIISKHVIIQLLLSRTIVLIILIQSSPLFKTLARQLLNKKDRIVLSGKIV
jgi:hypothetical protein